jgi:type VI secretion system secreted protein Hcp
MSVEIFLKLDGIEGESKVKGFEKSIDVLSFSWGASNPSSVARGGGSGAGRADFSSISIQKEVDLSSDKMMKAVSKGTHFAKGSLHVREAGGDTPVEYYVLELKRVFVDSFNVGGAQGGGKPTESLSFSYEEVKLKYIEQTEKGGEGGKGEFAFNIVKNAEA